MLALLVAAAVVTLESPDFGSGAVIARPLMARDCGGQNRPPRLSWSAAPAQTKSFALIERDPDAPLAGGFFHWVVYDIPGSARSIDAKTIAAGGRTGTSSTGKAAYYGPCPPPGPAHHYLFTLYALDVTHAGATSATTGSQLEALVRGHVLAQATLEGIASH